MKKLFTLVAMALCAVGMSAQTAWIATQTSGTLAAETTLVDDEVITVKTVFASNTGTDTGTGVFPKVDGTTLSAFIQLRTTLDPTEETLTGTETTGSTPLIVTSKKNATFTIYFRRQKGSNGYNVDDNKDLLAKDQADLSSVFTGSEEVYGKISDEAYGYCSKTYTLEKGHTYTLYRAGSTMRIFGFIYEANERTVTISDFGYSTFASTKGLDLSEVEGLKAYTATFDAANNKLVLTEVTEVPANTGIILEGTANTEYTIPTADVENASVTSDLKAVTSDITVDGTKANYVLANVDGVPGFYKYTGTEIAAGHAYLELDSEVSGAKGFTLSFGEATAISTVKASTVNADNTYYNLNGQRVAAPAKGLYILNGKKVIIK